MDNVASIFADTLQSILSKSVVCKTIFEPLKTSKDEPAGISTSLTTNVSTFVSTSTVFELILTLAVTAVVWTLQSINPRTTEVVADGTV